LDVEPWPAKFHPGLCAPYRAGFEPIRDLPGLGGMPAWVGAGALTSAHENGERAGESNGHAPPPGMSHSPSQSDSSIASLSPLPRTLAPAHMPIPPTHPPRRHQAAAAPKKVGWTSDERRGVGVHTAHGADLVGECIGEVTFLSLAILCLSFRGVALPLGGDFGKGWRRWRWR
ncbi:hypothetical protein C8R44DRAFT_774217, partial [Mycena epipterygia]